MELKLSIDSELCIACMQCASVCIRDNIIVEDVAQEVGSNCFECGHCMAICRQNAITLKSFEGREDRIEDYNPCEIPVEYDDLLQLLKQRRSIRCFKDEKIDEATFDKLFEAAINLDAEDVTEADTTTEGEAATVDNGEAEVGAEAIEADPIEEPSVD